VDDVVVIHTRPPDKGIAAGKRGGSFCDTQKIDPEQEVKVKEALAFCAGALRDCGVKKMQFEGRALNVVRA
jgi:hypothetical protein